jgi:hypothetical protein
MARTWRSGKPAILTIACFADIHIEQRVVAAPSRLLLPAALRDVAIARPAHAPQLLGPVTLHGIIDVDPVWRPLIVALGNRSLWRRASVFQTLLPGWAEADMWEARLTVCTRTSQPGDFDVSPQTSRIGDVRRQRSPDIPEAARRASR